MKNTLLPVLFFALIGLLSAAESAAPAAAKRWWQEGDGSERHQGDNPQATALPLISVKGNRFVNPAGEPMLFRGVSVADPDKLVVQGRWNRALFAAVKDMGANLVRLPVHPVAWRERTPEAYLAVLD